MCCPQRNLCSNFRDKLPLNINILVRATVAERAFFVRGSVDVVNEVAITVSHLDVNRPFAAVPFPAKTDLPGDFTVCHFRMRSIHPTGGVRTTSQIRDT